MAKTTVICVEFLFDVARQKLLKSAHAAQSYSNSKSGMFFMDHGVHSSNEPGELSQWQFRHDSNLNTVLATEQVLCVSSCCNIHLAWNYLIRILLRWEFS